MACCTLIRDKEGGSGDCGVSTRGKVRKAEIRLKGMCLSMLSKVSPKNQTHRGKECIFSLLCIVRHRRKWTRGTGRFPERDYQFFQCGNKALGREEKACCVWGINLGGGGRDTGKKKPTVLRRKGGENT